MMADDTLKSRVDEMLCPNFTGIQKRDSADYDGVMGQLPKAFPDNFRHEFRFIRDRLLATYSHADLLRFITEARDMGMRGSRDAGEFAELVELLAQLEESESLPEVPGGMLTGEINNDAPYLRPITPFNIMRDVSRLAQLQEAGELGPEDGLALLTDQEHAKRAIKGRKFPSGKPKGAISPVARKILAYLKKHPAARPPEVWEALKDSPPSGHVFMDNTQCGKYIEKDSHGTTVMGWRRFCNLVSEHRPK